MKKFLIFFTILCFISVGTFAVAKYVVAPWKDDAGSLGEAGRAWNTAFINDITFEGATADSYETNLDVTDPTADRSITLPDYGGAIPIVISQSSTQTSEGDAATEDVTGSSVSISAGWMTAGKAIKWTIAGTITGANGAKTLHLYNDDATKASLALASGTSGDYVAEFIMYEHTDTANQDIIGRCEVAGDAETEVAYEADTQDYSSAGTAKLQVQLANESDTITVEYVKIETWEE